MRLQNILETHPCAVIALTSESSGQTRLCISIAHVQQNALEEMGAPNWVILSGMYLPANQEQADSWKLIPPEGYGGTTLAEVASQVDQVLAEFPNYNLTDWDILYRSVAAEPMIQTMYRDSTAESALLAFAMLQWVIQRGLVTVGSMLA